MRVGRNARDVVKAARERGVHPGYALGRDYEGMDDVLLVAVTEKRTPAEIDRLAEVLAEVARVKLIYEKSQAGPPLVGDPAPRRPARAGGPRGAAARPSRRDFPRCTSSSSSATSPSSRSATSGSTPASTRSARAR